MENSKIVGVWDVHIHPYFYNVCASIARNTVRMSEMVVVTGVCEKQAERDDFPYRYIKEESELLR